MTEKLLIKRELLEQAAMLLKDGAQPPEGCANFDDWTAQGNKVSDELCAILATPRQPEGDAISRERVQAEADAFFDWPTADKSSVTTTSCLIFARCIAGMVAAERDATIAELREQVDNLELHLASTEDDLESARRNASAFENRMGELQVENGNLQAERDTLRQQLAELDAAIEEWSGTAVQNGMECDRLADQRDKLAGLLRDERTYAAMPMSCQIGMVEVCHCSRCRLERIDAALAEVGE